MSDEAKDDRQDLENARRDKSLSQVEAYCKQFGRNQLRRYLLPYNTDTSVSSSTTTCDDIRPLLDIDIDTRMAFLDKIYNPQSTKSNPVDPLIDIPTTSKSEESISEISKEIQDDDQLINKTVSPPSSVTSRRLEWDSLADIGYENVDKIKISSVNALSTIERMALDTHHKLDLIVDFETNNVLERGTISLGTPDAQSTPTLDSVFKRPSLHRNSIKTKDQSKRSSPSKSVKPKINLRKKSVSKVRRIRDKIHLKRNISIHVDVSSKDSQSQISSNSNIVADDEKKESTQSSAAYSDFNTSSPVIVSDNVSSVRLTEDVPSTDLQKEPSLSNSSENDNLNIIAMISTIEDNDESLLSKAQSFEFMPGHVYNQKYCPNEDSPPTSPKIVHLESYRESSLDVQTQSTQNTITLSEQSSATEYDVKLLTYPPKKRFSSNIKVVNELVQSRHANPALRERLAKKILHLLDKTDVSIESNNDMISTENRNKIPNRIVIKDSECQTETINRNLITVHKNDSINIEAVKVVENGNDKAVLYSNKESHREEINVKAHSIDKFCQTTLSSHSSQHSNDLNRRAIYDEFLKSKMRENLLKKEKPEFHFKSHNQLSVDIDTTQRKLKKIDVEILKLELLKEKLKNKRSNVDSSKSSSKNLSSDSSDFQTQDVVNSLNDEIKTSFPTSKSIVDVPFLNLKSSSDELNENFEKKKVKTPSKRNLRKSSTAKSETHTCNCNDSSNPTSESLFSDPKELLIRSKLKRFDENFVKYKKCVVMKAFMKDYDALIEKYRKTRDSTERRRVRVSGELQNVIDDTSNSTERISTVTKVLEGKSSVTAPKDNSQRSDLDVPISKSYESEMITTSNSNSSELQALKKRLERLVGKSSTERTKSETGEQTDSTVSTSRSEIKDDLKEILRLMKRFEKHLHNVAVSKYSPVAKTDAITQVPSSSTFTNSKLPVGNNIELKKITVEDARIKSIENPRKSFDDKPLVTDLKDFKTPEESKQVDSKKKLPCPCKKSNSIKCKKYTSTTQRRIYPKAVAYSLILEPSDSIIDESILPKSKKVLDEIVVKVPKTMKRYNAQMIRDVKDRASAVTKAYVESLDMTDDQLKEFSSLNDSTNPRSLAGGSEQSTSKYVIDTLSDGRKDVDVTENGKESIRKNLFSVEDYLKKNRPKFIDRANKRHEYIREIYEARRKYETDRRKQLEKNLKNKAKPNGDCLPKIPILKYNKIPAPVNRKIGNAREIVRKTARQYKKLPEILKMKEILQKQRQKKANRLISELFVKKLQQKALKGIVNISHNSDIISL